MGTKFATALCKEENSFEVGKKAAEQALSKLNSPTVSLCTLFASIHYDLTDVIKGIRSVIGSEAELIGCSSAGEFNETQCDNESVTVGLFASDTYRFKVFGQTGLKENIDQVFQSLKQDSSEFLKEEGITSAMMMIDGLAGNGEECALSAVAAFETDMKIVGGAAGDNLAFNETKVIAGDQVLSDGIALCLVKGAHPFFTGVKHGHKPLSESMTATRAEGNVLYTINDQPAWEVWKEKTRETAKSIGIDVDALSDASSIGSFLLMFELGLETDKGYKIRVPLSLNDDGSMNFACTLPQDIKFRIMQSNKEDQIQSAREAAILAKESVGDLKIAGIVIFDCVCRGLILGKPQFCEAINAIREVLGKDIPLQGFETYGEICMDTFQFSGFHNTTSVITVIPE